MKSLYLTILERIRAHLWIFTTFRGTCILVAVQTDAIPGNDSKDTTLEILKNIKTFLN
jgi:hypothetical protein